MGVRRGVTRLLCGYVLCAVGCSADLLTVDVPPHAGMRAAWIVTSAAGADQIVAYDLEAGPLAVVQPLAAVERVRVHYFAASLAELAIAPGPVALVPEGRPVPPPQASYSGALADGAFGGWQELPPSAWTPVFISRETDCPTVTGMTSAGSIPVAADVLGHVRGEVVVGARVDRPPFAPQAFTVAATRTLDASLASIVAVGERRGQVLAIDQDATIRVGSSLDTLTATATEGWEAGYVVRGVAFGSEDDSVELWVAGSRGATVRYATYRQGRFETLGERERNDPYAICATIGRDKAICRNYSESSSPMLLSSSGITAAPVPVDLTAFGDGILGALAVGADGGVYLGLSRGRVLVLSGTTWRVQTDSGFGDLVRTIVPFGRRLLLFSRGDALVHDPETDLNCPPHNLQVAVVSSAGPLSASSWLLVTHAGGSEVSLQRILTAQ